MSRRIVGPIQINTDEVAAAANRARQQQAEEKQQGRSKVLYSYLSATQDFNEKPGVLIRRRFRKKPRLQKR
jgi:hypothetical protein